MEEKTTHEKNNLNKFLLICYIIIIIAFILYTHSNSFFANIIIYHCHFILFKITIHNSNKTTQFLYFPEECFNLMINNIKY